MTTSTTAPKKRHWWGFLGPWPVSPLPVGMVLFLAAFIFQSTQFIGTPNLTPIGNSLVYSGSAAVALWLAGRFLPSIVATGWGYAAALTMTGVVAVAARLLQGDVFDFIDLSGPLGITLALTRTVVIIVVVQTVVGNTQARLRAQIDAKEQALKVIEQQSSALLRADEQVRHAVAMVLHDRVQAGLLAACLRLQLVQDVSAPIPPGTRSPINDNVTQVIKELEELRTVDVRRAVRALSPNLQDLDLQAALDDLGDSYRPAIEVEVRVPAGLTLDLQVSLGIYRIAEQALMNAIAHGHASRVAIEVVSIDGHIKLSIVDDGVGLEPHTTFGFGSTLIDTWCRTLQGRWSRRPGATGGTVVTALLQQPSAID